MSKRREDDFAAYVTARWATLVRALVLLGSPPDEADAIARDGLARCWSGWSDVEDSEDIDVIVHRTVLDARRRTLRRRTDADVIDSPRGTPYDQGGGLRHALEQALAAADEKDRIAVVLRLVAGLSEEQVADVLGESPESVFARVSGTVARLDLEALQELPR